MPVEVQGPDGTIYEFPDGTPQTVMRAALGKVYGAPKAEKKPPPGRGKGGFREKLDAATRGLGDVLSTGFADEATAAVYAPLGATIDAVKGKGFNLGRAYNRQLGRERATDRYDEENNAGTRLAGQLVGGAMIPFGSGAKTATQIAKVGGLSGAAYGLGSGEDVQDRLEKAVTGGAAGAALGYGVGKLGERLATRAARVAAPKPGTEVMEAAERLGAQVMPADVGGRTVQGATAAMAQSPFGQGAIRDAAERSVASTGAARDRVAASAGQILSPEQAGAAVKRGATAFRETTSAKGGDLYRVAEELSGNMKLPVPNAVAAIDDTIAKFSETPNAAASSLNVLKSLRADLADDAGAKPITIEGLRRLRTSYRQEFAAQGLRGSDIERRVNGILDQVTDDIQQGLSRAGKADAANAYALADRFWRNRVEQIDDVLEPIIGKSGDKAAEQVFASFERLASEKSGNAERLTDLLQDLPVEEADSLRATLISRLGQATSGAQDDVKSVFSPARFVTQWNDMSEASKSVLFSDKATRSALDDLAKVTSAQKNAQRIANSSNTANAVAWIGTLATLPIDPTGPVIAGAGQYGLAKLMASPAFAKWLARSTKAASTGNVAARQAAIRELTQVAAKTPTLRNEVISLQQRLAGEFGVGGLAAADEEKNKERQSRPGSIGVRLNGSSEFQ